MSEARCPHCRAPILASAGARPDRCVFCKQPLPPSESNASRSTTAEAPGWAPAPPPGRSASGPVGAPSPVAWTTVRRPDTRLMAGGVALALVTVGLVVMVGFRGAAPAGKPAPRGFAPVTAPAATSVETPSGPAPRPTPAVAAPSVEPMVRLVSSREATTRIGGRYFLVTVDNPGTIPIEGVSALATGYTTDGRSVVSQPGYAVRGRLEPGEATVLLVLVARPPAEATRYEVTAGRARAATGPVHEVPLDVADIVEMPSSSGFHELRGALVNTSGGPVRFAKVVAIGRDAAGAPCAFADGFAQPSDVPVGGRAPFSLSVGTFEVERPARWELVGLGWRD